ncbi:DsbA family protein [Stappia sp. ES.058]|uniref:DsbA family protein n=1 Tax=Stappia sp. ES.058 TaxID=1881061 RepID=UPI00087A494D|nr:DsbA family protein [Stappia sp. ES.058]SDU17440.1 Protein-disulfide isomerase [Stappia sp. ES.058]
MKTNFAAALTKSLKPAMLALATVVLLLAPAQAQDGILKRGDVETIVREYLMENPNIVREALEELERREVAAADAARAQAVSTVSDVLFNSTRQVELGNPDGDVTLVEFFDYNCGYCKRAMTDMMRLIEEDDDLRIVLKEFPVLGEGSVQAAQVAVAVNKIAPEKYLEFHRELMSARGQANRAAALEAAKNTGLDIDAVEAAMNDPEVRATIEEVYTLARRLGLNGTPAYVVGEEVLMGAVGYDRLKQGINAARNCGEATC